MSKMKNDKISKLLLREKKPTTYVTTRGMDLELHKFLLNDARSRDVSLNKLTLMIFKSYREEQIK